MENKTLEKIAERLKFERLEKNFTLEQVIEHTKMSKKFIMAIEDGQFNIFPAFMYLYGFVSNLCEMYGIDDKDILASLKEGMEETGENDEEKLAEGERETHLQDKEQPLLRRRHYSRISIVGAIIVAAFLFIFLIKISLGKKEHIKSITPDNVVTQKTLYKMNDQKETFDLKVKDEVDILFNSSYQKLVVKEIKESEVKFYLNDSEFALMEEGDIAMDVDGDETEDMEIRLKKISGELAIVHINQIHYNDKAVNYQNIWDTQEHILVKTDYALFKNQEKKPIEVYVKALKLPSHLSYHLDGRRQNTTMLDTGKDIIISAEEHLEIIIGNYRSVMFIVNKIPINLTLDNDKHSVTKIIKWVSDPNNETRFDLVIKDYVN